MYKKILKCKNDMFVIYVTVQLLKYICSIYYNIIHSEGIKMNRIGIMLFRLTI